MITGIRPSSFGFRPFAAFPGAFDRVLCVGACDTGTVVFGAASPPEKVGAFRASASDV
jgi:hypothetical protein